AHLTAPFVTVAGGTQITGNATVSPRTAGSVPDPLAGLIAPTAGTSLGAIKITGGSQTISAGTYSSIEVAGTGSLNMKPGVYVIEGGGFKVSGQGSVYSVADGSTPAGVTIYNTKNAAGTYGSVN